MKWRLLKGINKNQIVIQELFNILRKNKKLSIKNSISKINKSRKVIKKSEIDIEIY